MYSIVIIANNIVIYLNVAKRVDLKCSHHTIKMVAMGQDVRQAGTWDPLLQCLHLDKHLLEEQNTKKL